MVRIATLGVALAAALAATAASAQGHAGRSRPAFPAPSAVTPAPLDERTKAAILEGLADERKTEAIYLAVIEKHGEIRPFTNTARAEDRHARFLEQLLSSRGLAVPEAKATPPAPAPPTVGEACQAALESERANVALYGRLLEAGPLPDDVKSAFEHNRWASLEPHIPAFERCVARGGSSAAARCADGLGACHRGCGHGHGHGAGHRDGGTGCCAAQGRGCRVCSASGCRGNACCEHGCGRGPAGSATPPPSGKGGV